MKNIHVKRYDHPEATRYAGTIEPEDGSWILFVPEDGSTPELHVQVEVAVNEEDDNPEAFERGEVATMKAYTPAIYLDDRVTIKPEAVEALAQES